MKQQSRQENVIYLAMWVMLFMAPVLSMYLSIVSGGRYSFDWQEVFFAWQKFAVFLALFLVHNFLLAPLLINGHSRVRYLSLTLPIIACFIIYQCTTRPALPDRKHPPMEHRMHQHHPLPPSPEGEGNMPPRGHKPRREHVGPPAFIGEHDIVASVILILMFGMNLGVKGYFKSREDRKRMLELEHENLEQQLEYLKYQINPHFFMNTLNNIHALVDIDPEQAKHTIVELSKMMRFILYEGDRNGVTLSREMEFIRTYVTLMRLRYTDKVTIRTNLPSEMPDNTIPPLILIPFVENAFKHGISYLKQSFIDIKVTVQSGKLRFLCLNSKADKSNEEKGGVGLANVRKRLDLLYGHDYTLNIQDEAESYRVELLIPLNSQP
jgi:hypothetical protein